MTFGYNPFIDNFDFKGSANSGGNVVGPGSSIIGNFAAWDDTTGTTLADSGVNENDFVEITGDTMTGYLTLVGNPVGSNDAANKAYVDAVASGAVFKQVVVAASTANLVATYANGAAGVGATLTNNSTLAAFMLDGVSLSLNDRVLIKNQSTQAQNGSYTVTTVGSGAAAWILTRSTDYDQAAEILPGTVFPIASGTVNANTSWIETDTVTTVGTDAIFFSQFTYNSMTFLQVANNLSDVANVASSRSNLGLGSAALLNDPITETHGGTAQTTYTAGDILYASGANTLAKLPVSTNGKVLTLAAGIPSWATPTTGTVTSVSGTVNRVTSTGGATPVIDIDAAYVGQSSITTLGTVSTGTWNATAISAVTGGTGQTGYATGDVLYASSTTALSKLAAGSDGKVLTLASGIPSWQTPTTGTVTSVSGTTNRVTSTGGATPVIDIDAAYVGQSSITTLGTVTTGTWSATAVGATKGGTGQTGYVVGDILYASTTTALSRLPVGSNTNVLTLTGGVPTWAAPTTGTVTSVSGTANRVSSTGGNTPVIDIDAAYVGQSSITTLGTVTTGTWSATAVGPTKGGTGLTTYATGDLIYASAANTLSKLAVGSNTNVLTLTGGVPVWAAAPAGTVTSVSGTANRISSTGGATPVIDIDAAYIGQSSITTLGTVTTGTWSATNIALNKGGTNAALTASNGGIFYSTATAGAILAGTGTANKVLLSGATAPPTWSTPTFPGSASATSRKIIVSDGTNWVASTETYATPSTSGNILTSDGTNWTSAAPAAPVINPSAVINMFDEFLGASIVSTVLSSGLTWYQSGFAVNLSGITLDAGHPGIITQAAAFSSGATLLSMINTTASTFSMIKLGGGAIQINWVFKLNTLSDGTNRYTFQCGLGDCMAGTTTNSNGVFFSYSDNVNSGNWTINTVSATSPTVTNTSVAATTGWHNLQIVINAAASSCTFTIDGAAQTAITNTIPTTSISPFIYALRVLGTIPSHTLEIDLFSMSQTLTTPR